MWSKDVQELFFWSPRILIKELFVLFTLVVRYTLSSPSTQHSETFPREGKTNTFGSLQAPHHAFCILYNVHVQKMKSLKKKAMS